MTPWARPCTRSTPFATRFAISDSARWRPRHCCAESWRRSTSPSSPSTTTGIAFVNRAGERLVGQSAERLIVVRHRTWALSVPRRRTASRRRLVHAAATERDRRGAYEIRRSTFRQAGSRITLVVVSDLSRALRDEERQAWQRLVRVLGHEINLARNHSLDRRQHSTTSSPLAATRRLSTGCRARSHRQGARPNRSALHDVVHATRAAAAAARSPPSCLGLGASRGRAREADARGRARRSIASHSGGPRPLEQLLIIWWQRRRRDGGPQGVYGGMGPSWHSLEAARSG